MSLLGLLASVGGCMHDLAAFPVIEGDLRAADQRPSDLPVVDADRGPIADVGPDLGRDATFDLPMVCPGGPDGNTLLFFGFEGTGSTVIDTSGSQRDGLLRGAATREPGMASCGKAASFVPTPGTSVRVAHSNVWDLGGGSIDLSLRFTAPSIGTMGILSREATGTEKKGHLTLLKRSGYLVVRLEYDEGKAAARCFPKVPVGRWLRVGINFGAGKGLQLWVDGQLANAKKQLSWGPETIPCGTSTTSGIKGNRNPWIIGAHTRDAQEGHSGGTSTVSDPLYGEIDNLRISSVRRDYAQDWQRWQNVGS